MRLSYLPDYVLSEAEDRARPRYLTPSNISPWRYGVSKVQSITDMQEDELRRRGLDPKTADWMWVVVPVPEYEQFDRYKFGQAVQHLYAPILRTIGDRIQVLTPQGRMRSVYAGGRLSNPNRKRAFRGMMGRG